jgi:hypothetical protein
MDKDKPRTSQKQAQCVWVSAGVLHHHICDHDFDCDACPLHQALSPPTSRAGGQSAQWPKDRMYTDNHLWLETTSDDSVRIGLTSLATQLLHPVSGWHVDRQSVGESESRISVTAEMAIGEMVCSLPQGLGAYKANSWIDIDPIWPTADPWISGYLLEADVENWSLVRVDGRSLREVAPVYSHHRGLVHDALKSVRDSGTDQAPTADGGIPVAGLLAVLGPVLYGRLIREVLRPVDYRP